MCTVILGESYPLFAILCCIIDKSWCCAFFCVVPVFKLSILGPVILCSLGSYSSQVFDVFVFSVVFSRGLWWAMAPSSDKNQLDLANPQLPKNVDNAINRIIPKFTIPKSCRPVHKADSKPSSISILNCI